VPVFSIIIPTYARPDQLATCLQALTRLDYPRDGFEVIVVDDGSQTPPEAVVASCRDQLDVTLLTQSRAGPAAARNAGAARARGKFLVFTDDDCAPAPDWLRTLASHFATAEHHAIGGRTLNALPHNRYSTASQLIVDYLYAYFNVEPTRPRFFASNNLALPVDRFQAIGGFNATFPWAAAEDREFCERWLHHGYPMTCASDALVYHAHALTFRTFWRQQFNYGRGAFRLHRLRAQCGGGRRRLEPFSFYLNLLRYPLSQAHGLQALVLAMLVLVSQAAIAWGWLYEAGTAGNA
jgi:glycosyltransferase involved in cell wall biosynthesis